MKLFNVEEIKDYFLVEMLESNLEPEFSEELAFEFTEFLIDKLVTMREICMDHLESVDNGYKLRNALAEMQVELNNLK